MCLVLPTWRDLFDFLLLVSAALLAGFLWTRFQAYRTRNWPATEGVIESGAVTVRHQFPKGPREIAEATLSYSYRAGETFYAGQLNRTFTDEQKAWNWVDSLKGQRIIVRYNPRKPDSSVAG